MRVSFICSRRTLLICLTTVLTALLLLEALAVFGTENEVHLNNEEERAAYLRSLGLTVSGEPVFYRQITVPLTFTPVYETYNRVQQAAGFDLRPYAGKTVEQYTYRLSELVDLHILVYANRLIGGDICETPIHGRMWPLNKEYACENRGNTAG